MKEIHIINQTSMPNTVISMIHDLNQIGVVMDDTVLVHSSLFSIGWVCGGETEVISVGTLQNQTRSSNGSAECKLFQIREGVDFAVDWLKRNRLTIL